MCSTSAKIVLSTGVCEGVVDWLEELMFNPLWRYFLLRFTVTSYRNYKIHEQESCRIHFSTRHGSASHDTNTS